MVQVRDAGPDRFGDHVPDSFNFLRGMRSGGDRGHHAALGLGGSHVVVVARVFDGRDDVVAVHLPGVIFQVGEGCVKAAHVVSGDEGGRELGVEDCSAEATYRVVVVVNEFHATPGEAFAGGDVEAAGGTGAEGGLDVAGIVGVKGDCVGRRSDVGDVFGGVGVEEETEGDDGVHPQYAGRCPRAHEKGHANLVSGRV